MDDLVCDNFEYNDACVRVVGDEVERSNAVDQPCKRRKLVVGAGKRRSFVWEHFDIMSEGGRLHAQCKYCEGTNYRAEGHYGTTNCRRHLISCNAYKNAPNKKSSAKKLDRTNEKLDRTNDFDEQVFCQLFADAIVAHDLPLSIVEDVGMRNVFVYLNPKVADIPISTIKKKVEALVAAARKGSSGYEGAKKDGVVVIKDDDAESLECYSSLH